MRTFLTAGALIPVLLSPTLLAQQDANQAQPPEAPKLPVEIIDPTPHLPGIPGWIILLTILVCVIPLAALVFFLLQKKDGYSFKSPGISPHAEAKVRLEELRELAEQASLAEISTRISLIIRQYLARAKADSALFQTREEFLTDEERLRDVPEPAKGETADFLSELASLQYAPPTKSPEQSMNLIEQGLTTLERLSEPEPPSSESHD